MSSIYRGDPSYNSNKNLATTPELYPGVDESRVPGVTEIIQKFQASLPKEEFKKAKPIVAKVLKPNAAKGEVNEGGIVLPAALAQPPALFHQDHQKEGRDPGFPNDDAIVNALRGEVKFLKSLPDEELNFLHQKLARLKEELGCLIEEMKLKKEGLEISDAALALRLQQEEDNLVTEAQKREEVDRNFALQLMVEEHASKLPIQEPELSPEMKIKLIESGYKFHPEMGAYFNGNNEVLLIEDVKNLL